MQTSVSGRRITLEVCVTTVEEALVAVAGGADRLELCSALEVGGLTPSPATFLEARAAVTVPLYVLLRPRPGWFSYPHRVWATIRRDADWFLAHGAHGVVGGVLDGAANGEVKLHRDRCRELVHASGGRMVLHRCFDFLPDLAEGLGLAIDVGVERVLTSGGAPSAIGGAAVIRDLIRRAAGRIEVLPGGGIHRENVAELVATTGCDQVHGSFRSAGPDVRHPLAGSMGREAMTDADKVAAVRAELDRLTGG
ncbi:MAG: copper homeostasis protein CutC [Gemmataceae bacterium]